MMKDEKMMLKKIDESFTDGDGKKEEESRGIKRQKAIEESSTFIESKYVYEYYEENEMNDILQRVDHLLIDNNNNVGINGGNNNERQSFNGMGGGGDASSHAQIFQAQLVQIRIRPQYIEYIRAKHGWSSMCKFKPKIPQQYIQRTRTLLSSSNLPQTFSADPLQQTSKP